VAATTERSPRGVVAAGHPETVRAATSILAAGGNAIDAAIAAGFAACVVEPCLSSLGGGGFLLVRTAAGEEVVVDFFVDTPGRGLPGDTTPALTPVTLAFGAAEQVFHVGHGSVAVPGCLPGYLHAHARFGRLPLDEVVAPARALAVEGVPLGRYQTFVVHLLEPILTLSEAGRRRYTPGGRRLTEDDRVPDLRLAAFLEDVGAGRVRGFDDVGLASAIAAQAAAGGGLLTAEDLAAYEVVEREPLRLAYGDGVLVTNPPPSFGGELIAHGLERLAADPPTRAGTGQRLTRLADVFDEVMRRHTARGDASTAPDTRPRRSRGTTHVSVCDDEGNLAAMTTSNGSCSGVLLADTGVMANNIMGEEDLNPHLRDGGSGGHPAPGQRVGSMMAPSLLLRDGRPPVVLGSGGSERIRTAMTQVLVGLVDDGLSLEDAVLAPRIHWDGTTVQVEPGFAEDAVAELAGRRSVNVWSETDLYFGGVHGVSPDGARAGDPRRGGATGIAGA
jgi:gamma-glutamyltranspeptidase / glutathione hydrolase